MNGKRPRSFGSAWMHMVRLVAGTMIVVLLAAFLLFQYSHYEEQKTKADVWKKTRHFELRSHKRAVLGVLVFIVLLGMFLAAEVSSGYVEKVSRRWKAGRNYEKPAARWKPIWMKGLMEICLSTRFLKPCGSGWRKY